MADESQVLGPRKLRRLIVFIATSLVLVSVVATIYGALLVPLITSAFLTYLLEPLVRIVERWLPRPLAVALMVLGSVLAIIIAGIKLAPLLYQELSLIVQQIPGALNTLMTSWLGVARKFISNLGVVDEVSLQNLFEVGPIVSRFANQLQAGVPNLWKAGASVAGGLLNMLLIPVLTFFFLKDRQRIAMALTSAVPLDLRTPLRRLLMKIDRTLRSVLKGQAIVAGLLGVLYVLGLSIVGVQSAVAIGVIAGICRVIPYMDVIVGGALSAIVLISNHASWGQLLSVALVFATVQAVDGILITPSVIGERIGLHPMVVVLSVIALGDWLGFWGVLLAVPVAAICKVVVEASFAYYRRSRTYRPLETDTPLDES